jgi:hypothetical protein
VESLPSHWQSRTSVVGQRLFRAGGTPPVATVPLYPFVFRQKLLLNKLKKLRIKYAAFHRFKLKSVKMIWNMSHA